MASVNLMSNSYNSSWFCKNIMFNRCQVTSIHLDRWPRDKLYLMSDLSFVWTPCIWHPQKILVNTTWHQIFILFLPNMALCFFSTSSNPKNITVSKTRAPSSVAVSMSTHSKLRTFTGWLTDSIHLPTQPGAYGSFELPFDSELQRDPPGFRQAGKELIRWWFEKTSWGCFFWVVWGWRCFLWGGMIQWWRVLNLHS